MLFLKLACGISQKCCFGFALLILNGWMRYSVIGSTDIGGISLNDQPSADNQSTLINEYVISRPRADQNVPHEESHVDGGATANPTTDRSDQYARRLNYKRAKVATTTAASAVTEDAEQEASEAAHGGEQLHFVEVPQLDRPPYDSAATTTSSPLLVKRVVPAQRDDISHAGEERPSSGQSHSFDVEYAHNQESSEQSWEASRMPPPDSAVPTAETVIAAAPTTIATNVAGRPRFRTSLRRSNVTTGQVTSAPPVRSSAVEAGSAPDEVTHNRVPDYGGAVNSANASRADNNVAVVHSHEVTASPKPSLDNDNDNNNNQQPSSNGQPDSGEPYRGETEVEEPIGNTKLEETNTINFRGDLLDNIDSRIRNTSWTTPISSVGEDPPSLEDNRLDLLPDMPLSEGPDFPATNLTEVEPSVKYGDRTTAEPSSTIQFRWPEPSRSSDLHRPTPIPQPSVNSTGDGVFRLHTIANLDETFSMETGVAISTADDDVRMATADGDWTGVFRIVPNRTGTFHSNRHESGIVSGVLLAGGGASMTSSVFPTTSSAYNPGTTEIKFAENGEPHPNTVEAVLHTPQLDSRIFRVGSGTEESHLRPTEVLSPSFAGNVAPTYGADSNSTTSTTLLGESNHDGPLIDPTKSQSDKNGTEALMSSPWVVVLPSPVVSSKPITHEVASTASPASTATLSFGLPEGFPPSDTGKLEKNVTHNNGSDQLLVASSSFPSELVSATPALSNFEIDQPETSLWSSDYDVELASSILQDGVINETELIATVRIENSLETVTLSQPDSDAAAKTESDLVSSILVTPAIKSPTESVGSTRLDNLSKDPIPPLPTGAKPDYVLPTVKVPLAYLSITMKCSWSYFCLRREDFQQDFAEHLTNAMKMKVFHFQIVFFNINACNHVLFQSDNDVNHNSPTTITVPLYVSDNGGSYSKTLTELLGYLIMKNRDRGFGNNVTLHDVVLAVQVHRKDDTALLQSAPAESDMGIIAAITISSIAGTCLILLCILLIVLKRRQGTQQQRTRRCRPVTDAYSLDSISIYSSFCKRKLRASKRSYLNQGFEDPQAPTNKINFAGLANFCLDENALNEEYKKIPMTMAKLGELPQGAELKNRYANIIPFPETRVLLTAKPDDPCSDYINANYVRGFKCAPKSYIACQAPLENTIVDFWQMVWENQCKVVIMLTNLEEEGVSKCASYFAESETIDSHRLFGDYQVTTKKKDQRETYVVTYIQIKNLEKNLMREVVHFWYTAWPAHNTPPDHVSVAEMLVEARPSIKNNSGPTIVHCSTGAGRTGAVIAINICMQEFETSRTVDIPKAVYRLRQDRGGLVQTMEQYIFIYQVLNEFASKIMNHSERSSLRSSR